MGTTFRIPIHRIMAAQTFPLDRLATMGAKSQNAMDFLPAMGTRD